VAYPDTLDEFETLERLEGGASCIRYGDGEFWIMQGRNNSLQCYEPDLAAELTRILNDPPPGVLMCIPRLNDLPADSYAYRWWMETQRGGFPPVPPGEYGSAFITRPDSAPWIHTVEYRKRIEALWRGKHVTIVSNDGTRGFTPDLLVGVRSLTFLQTPARHAWETCKGMSVGEPELLIVACGPTGKVLADRRIRAGGHVLDLGHLGMFFNRLKPTDLPRDPGDEGNELLVGRRPERIKDPQSGAWILP
jgi:hypothetical protein